MIIRKSAYYQKNNKGTAKTLNSSKHFQNKFSHVGELFIPVAKVPWKNLHTGHIRKNIPNQGGSSSTILSITEQ